MNPTELRQDHEKWGLDKKTVSQLIDKVERLREVVRRYDQLCESLFIQNQVLLNTLALQESQ